MQTVLEIVQIVELSLLDSEERKPSVLGNSFITTLPYSPSYFRVRNSGHQNQTDNHKQNALDYSAGAK